MSAMKKGSSKRFEDPMDDDSDDKDSKRKSRNLSEKKRRDQFNMLVNELSSMVSTGSRKMDKSTVLKSTISFLKNHNEITVRSRVNEIQEDWKPTFLTNEEFIHLVLEAVDGFIIIFSTSGQIYYTSESVASLLGYLPRDILKMTIYELTSEEEHSSLYNVLNPSEEEKPVAFSCHLKRGGPGSKTDALYELVHFMGYFRSDEDCVHGENRYSGYSGEEDTRLVFIGTGRMQTPQLIKEMPLVDSAKNEFSSRHSLEWKFLFLDHRAPPIIGYLPFELLGTSGYDYYHVDDLEKVVLCHESLMQKGEGTSCYYRFLTKSQQWIWLQTRFYITYHQWNSKPEFIVCTHRVISYIDVMKQSRKGEADSSENFDQPEEPSPSAIMSWTATSPNASVAGTGTAKSVVHHGPASDCTSMSADSPGSRQSMSTHQSTTKVRNTYGNTQPVISQSSPAQATTQQVLPQQSQPQQQLQSPAQLQPQPHLHQHPMQIPPQSQPIPSTQFLDPQHYVTAIPVQQLITNFPSPGVLSPTPVDNLVMSASPSQLQADLQRKHAELQVMIGQQQQELRRVSEQLLMARLGLLPGSQQQVQPPISYQTNNPGIVSSTTTTIQRLPPMQGPASVIVPVSVPISLPLQHQQTLMYSTPDSNTQSK
ncbi:circadian locomoter output cycles protein kaput isoform X1 [Diabrotica undecimpunctata]|uniref:circadian locomoter output cycles protein kaput isoform X1 n=1 Tax=Diabrotica undecimpunctata TaxID=50387 RepID=UPI003B632BA8